MACSKSSSEVVNKKTCLEESRQDTGKSFTPRDYQIEILESAKRENTIACLGTGTGKTFIAVMLIRENSNLLRLPYDAGGKRIFFLVPTVPLVMQQSKTIKDHTDLKVKGYYGEMDVDSWKKQQWEVEFSKYEVLVMTAEIFRIILDHYFIPLQKIQLLIFDECHRAQGDYPYRQAMKYISDQNPEDKPRIFGLSASLLNGKCKPMHLEKRLQELEKTLGAAITTASDITDIQKYGTDPDEYVIFFNKPDSTDCKNLMELLEAKIKKWCADGSFGKEKGLEVESLSIDDKPDPIFFNKPLKSMKQLFMILSTLGIWCALKAAEIFLKEIETLITRPFNVKYKNSLYEIRSFLIDFMKKCKECNVEINRENLAKYPHKLQRLIELYAHISVSEKFSSVQTDQKFPDDMKFDDDPVRYNEKLKHVQELKNSNGVPICSIIFVEQRITAYVLSQWMLEISQNIPELAFINPAFVVGHGCGTAGAYKVGSKETAMSVVKQRQVLKEFREKKNNVLIATSVLEEGMDIQQCNVVVRFDLPPDFRSYVQSKGRARAKNSIYVLLVDFSNDLKFLDDMCNFRTIEQMLLTKCRNRLMPTDEDIQDYMSDDLAAPFMPFGKNGPRITLTSSISLINRYCAKLPCDMTTKLAPRWEIKAIDPDSAKKTYLCHLRMPINSPLRKNICSEEMPQKRLAKMSAALKACQLLHEIGELNDNLVPISRLVDEALEEELGTQEEEICPDGVQPGTNRRRQIYKKHVPVFLSHAKPVSHTACYLHIFELDLVVPLAKCLNPRQRTLINPSDSTRGFGLLSAKEIPQVPGFRIFTKSGKVLVNVKKMESVFHFSENEILALEEFHRFIFNDVFPFEKGKIFAPDSTEFSCYIVPVNKGTAVSAYEIDWDFISMTKNHSYNVERQKTKNFERSRFEESLFKDAVVLKSYTAYTWKEQHPTFHFVTKIHYDKTPKSLFEEKNDYKTYKGYYKIKYNVLIMNDDQPLVETIICGNHTLWKPLYTSTKEVFDTSHELSKSKKKHQNYRSYLVPELCIIHPFPVPTFQKAFFIPTILFRLTSLLSAEELRQSIASNAFVGTVKLKQGFNWSDFNMETSDSTLTKHLVAIGEVKQQNTGLKLIPQDITKFGSEVISFEVPVDLKNNPGPSPSLILQALTATSTGDEFDLERLELIGDSFLKYAMSVKTYAKYPQFDEGKLTKLRIGLIRNLYLYQCAKKKKLSQYLICTCFDCKKTWLPPCYDVEEKINPKSVYKKPKSDKSVVSATQVHYFKHQIISDKCIADSVEALIGAYLLSCGQQGALRVMYWLGLNPIYNKDLENVHEKDFENWLVFPVNPIISEASHVEEQLASLTNGFEKFEQNIKYKFKNRAYLLQAFTHPSYSYNDITDCYQRLEFIGDAILDYLITRRLYEDPENHTPGELTDLRSALVNNIYFASLAVKYDFHKYLKMLSPTLFKLLTHYLETLENSEAFQMFKKYGYYLEEVECFELEEVEVPKALGDIFESVAGAIYFDSGMSLDAVWKVYQPLMKPAFDHYCKNVPKSPVRELYELVASKAVFGDAVVKDEKTYIEAVLPDGRKFCGVGPNKKVAKRSAAKRAIAEIKKEKMDLS